MPNPEVVDKLRGLGLGRGALLAVVVSPDAVGLAIPVSAGAGESGLARGAPTTLVVRSANPAAVVGQIDAVLRPRWVVWSADTAVTVVRGGARLSTAWDLAAVHRLLHGGWDAEPGHIWATLRGLAAQNLPAEGPINLFSQVDETSDADGPVRPDGFLRPEWIAGDWMLDEGRVVAWASTLAEAVHLQQAFLAEIGRSADRPALARTAHAESTAEVLCAEMTVGGLPVRREAAEAMISGYIGPRARSDREAAEAVAARDAAVLAHVPQGIEFDLRSPTQVRSMLRTVGVEVPDTRAWRLEEIREVHPLVDALLRWRKAERVQTTFGYAWLDEHLGDDGRFRGTWSASDGAAGRMTAGAGLHNMPADLRGGVVADPGHVFVRADLGQIEPRVLAAVSGDPKLAAATADDDLYAPVAAQLGVDRPTAKVAVLGAMYGQTTGHGAQALQGLKRSYPVAMEYLEAADRAAQVGTDLRTYGGRLVKMGSANVAGMGEREARSRAGARGRFGRNAMVQGAAAELFKVWAVIVRARGLDLGAEVVLCLHDELLVHVPEAASDAAVALVDDALTEAAHRWAPEAPVRFLADTSVITSWLDAKP